MNSKVDEFLKTHTGKGSIRRVLVEFESWILERSSYSKRPIEERFFSKFEIKGKYECWIWKAAGVKYGHIWKNGRLEKAHRVSWEIYYGEIPDGIRVLHSCNVKKCVNPEHLYLGTQKQNIQDAVRDGIFGPSKKRKRATLSHTPMVI